MDGSLCNPVVTFATSLPWVRADSPLLPNRRMQKGNVRPIYDQGRPLLAWRVRSGFREKNCHPPDVPCQQGGFGLLFLIVLSLSGRLGQLLLSVGGGLLGRGLARGSG